MQHQLYQRLAEYYDRIYDFKDYGGESQRIVEILSDHGVPPGGFVVDAACGTGEHLAHLQKYYRVAGFDVHDEMLDVARAKLAAEGPYGQVRLWRGDMQQVQLDEPADAIVCLFGSVAYVFPVDALERCAQRFYGSLRPGGVLLVEPFVWPDEYREGVATMQTYDGEEVKLVRCNVSKRQGRRAELDFHWLVATPGKDVEHFVDHHDLWLYTEVELLGALHKVGFEARYQQDGITPERGVVIAHRPPLS